MPEFYFSKNIAEKIFSISEFFTIFAMLTIVWTTTTKENNLRLKLSIFKEKKNVFCSILILALITLSSDIIRVRKGPYISTGISHEDFQFALAFITIVFCFTILGALYSGSPKLSVNNLKTIERELDKAVLDKDFGYALYIIEVLELWIGDMIGLLHRDFRNANKKELLTTHCARMSSVNILLLMSSDFILGIMVSRHSGILEKIIDAAPSRFDKKDILGTFLTLASGKMLNMKDSIISNELDHSFSIYHLRQSRVIDKFYLDDKLIFNIPFFAHADLKASNAGLWVIIKRAESISAQIINKISNGNISDADAAFAINNLISIYEKFRFALVLDKSLIDAESTTGVLRGMFSFIGDLELLLESKRDILSDQKTIPLGVFSEILLVVFIRLCEKSSESEASFNRLKFFILDCLFTNYELKLRSVILDNFRIKLVRFMLRFKQNPHPRQLAISFALFDFFLRFGIDDDPEGHLVINGIGRLILDSRDSNGAFTHGLFIQSLQSLTKQSI